MKSEMFPINRIGSLLLAMMALLALVVSGCAPKEPEVSATPAPQVTTPVGGAATTASEPASAASKETAAPN
jgi:PBP1b-binding outer membrane lipoprotein LpoB